MGEARKAHRILIRKPFCGQRCLGDWERNYMITVMWILDAFGGWKVDRSFMLLVFNLQVVLSES
jgi:hypothetical protein